MAAVLQATTELLADAGPSAVTTRAIAERANVNHALVFRHFETKDDLIRAALAGPIRDLGRQMVGTLGSGAAAVLDGAERNAATARMIARVAIDPESPFKDRWNFPLVRPFVGDARGHPEQAAPAVVAGVLLLGWALFESHLIEAAELDENGRQHVRAVLEDHLAVLLGEAEATIVRSAGRRRKRSRKNERPVA